MMYSGKALDSNGLVKKMLLHKACSKLDLDRFEVMDSTLPNAEEHQVGWRAFSVHLCSLSPTEKMDSTRSRSNKEQAYVDSIALGEQ